MRDFLEQKYGPSGYHVLALADLFHHSQTIESNIDGSTNAYDWTAVSNSLDMTFETGSKQLESIEWKQIVESNIAIPTFLDEMVEMIQTALLSTGEALSNFVGILYKQVMQVWAYIKSFFTTTKEIPKELKDSESETVGFFTSIKAYFISTGFFTVIAHKILAGLKSILVFVRNAVNKAVVKMAELFYAGLEFLYGSKTAATREIVKVGFFAITTMSKLTEYQKEKQPSNFMAKFIEQTGQQLSEFALLVATYLPLATTTTSWLYDNTPINWLTDRLKWLKSICYSIKSSCYSFVSSITLLGPLLDTMFGQFFQTLSESFKEKPLINLELDRVRQRAVELTESVHVSKAIKRGLKASIQMVDNIDEILEQSKLSKSSEEWIKGDSSTLTIAEILTQVYDLDGKDELDVQSIIDLVKNQTGLPPGELFFCIQSAKEITSAYILKAEVATFEKWKQGDSFIFGKAEDELLQNLNPTEEDYFEKLKSKSMDDLEELSRLKADEIVKALDAVDQFERSIKADRGIIEQSVMRTYLELVRDAEVKGHELSVDKAYAGGITVEAYQAIQNGALNRQRLSMWINTDNLRREFNLIQMAMNITLKPLGLRKAKYAILAGLLTVLVPSIVYGLILWYFVTPPTSFVTAVEIEKHVATTGWFGGQVINAIKDTVTSMQDIHPLQVLDIRNWWTFAKEATTVSILGFPRIVNLVSTIWNLAPAVHSIFLSSWFFWSTTIFTWLECKTPNYRSDARFTYTIGMNLLGSARAAFETALYKFGLVMIVYMASQFNQYVAIGTAVSTMATSLISLNPVSILTGLATGAQAGIEYQKNRVTEALNTRFDVHSLYVSDKLYKKLVPVSYKSQVSPLPLLSMTEMLEIKNLFLAQGNVISEQNRVLQQTRGEVSPQAIEEKKKRKKAERKQKNKTLLLEQSNDDEVLELEPLNLKPNRPLKQLTQ